MLVEPLHLGCGPAGDLAGDDVELRRRAVAGLRERLDQLTLALGRLGDVPFEFDEFRVGRRLDADRRQWRR
jgi:hypothetical protein